MHSDKEGSLKVVTAGIKVLERMAHKGKGKPDKDEYRLVQVRMIFLLFSQCNFK